MMTRRRAVGIAVALILISAIPLSQYGYSYWERSREQAQMKDVLGHLYDAQKKHFEQNGRYSLDLASLWAQAMPENLRPSRYAFGFQRDCVKRYLPEIAVAHSLDDSEKIAKLTYHMDFLKIQDQARAFFDTSEVTAECLSPDQGFLLFAVGTPGNGSLDIWVINHERTIANIQPAAGD